jgi:MerR family transcriptional regulator, light-induced transcriptional regulator
MRDSQHGGQGDHGSDGLSVLARSIVARLAARDAAFARVVDPDMVASIARAVATPDLAVFEALRPDLRRARISDIDLVDGYFPEVARFLGCAWADDRSPFTEVTIGVARMQAILRQVGRDWTSNVEAGPQGRTVLMVLPDGEQHSFGAMVLTGQMRRQGISVRLEIGSPPGLLRQIVRQQRFDCAMVSIACEEKLDHCRKVVDSLREGTGGRLHVAVGGVVLDRPVDVAGATGADIVTNDPAEAMLGARDGHPAEEGDTA